MIDAKGCFVTFNGSNVVNFLMGNRPLVFSDITTITSYAIDDNSETIIPARLEKLLPDSIIGVIESSTKLSDSYQLHIAASLSLPDSDGMVSLRILNHTDAPVLLQRGTSVGVFSEMAPNDTVLAPLISKKDWIEQLIVCLIGLLKPAKFSRRQIGEAKVLSRLLAEAANRQWTVDKESNFCAFGCINRL